jgi:hypothetical protein
MLVFFIFKKRQCSSSLSLLLKSVKLRQSHRFTFHPPPPRIHSSRAFTRCALPPHPPTPKTFSPLSRRHRPRLRRFHRAPQPRTRRANQRSGSSPPIDPPQSRPPAPKLNCTHRPDRQSGSRPLDRRCRRAATVAVSNVPATAAAPFLTGQDHDPCISFLVASRRPHPPLLLLLFVYYCYLSSAGMDSTPAGRGRCGTRCIRARPRRWQ